MGIIKDRIEIIGTAKRKRIQALFDSGAHRNYLKREFADGENVDEIGYHIFAGIHRAVLADGTLSPGERVRFKSVMIDKRVEFEPEFVLMENLIEDAIIGVWTMQKLGIRLDPPRERIEVE